MHLDGKNGQEIGSDGPNQRVKLGVGWGVGGVFPCLKRINASCREILGNKVVWLKASGKAREVFQAFKRLEQG